MKTYPAALSLLAAFSLPSLAADAPGGCCAMMKKEPAPQPACCCMKMAAKPEAAAAAPDMDALVDQIKTAKGDQLLDTLAAVLNKLIEERKATQGKPAEAPAHVH